MRKGDLVQLPHGLAPRWLYREIPAYGESTITVATDWRWGHGMVGIVIDVASARGGAVLLQRAGLTCLQVLTSAGHMGWISSSWAEVIDEAR